MKLFVTDLLEASAGTILSLYARRWGVEVTIKELKSRLSLGQMQVTRDTDRVARSIALPVCAYLLLVRLYGRDDLAAMPWSLFQLKQRFAVDVIQEQVRRTKQKWLRKFRQFKEASASAQQTMVCRAALEAAEAFSSRFCVSNSGAAEGSGLPQTLRSTSPPQAILRPEGG